MPYVPCTIPSTRRYPNGPRTGTDRPSGDIILRLRGIAWILAATLLLASCSLLGQDAAAPASDADPATGDADSSATSSNDTADANNAPEQPTERPTPEPIPVELPSAASAAEFAPLQFNRLAGPDRIQTAITVSQDTYQSTDTAIIARADDFADALAAAPLAAHLGAPILLTRPTTLDPTVLEELERLGAQEVMLLGGEAALDPQVAQSVEDSGRTVDRIQGADRFETAAAVAGRVPPSGRVYIATGLDYPDALAAGAAAARLPSALLLVGESLSAAATAVLDEQRPSEIVVVGGEAVVPPAVVDELEDGQASVTRLAGANRYATAVAVHDQVVDDFGGPEAIWLASAAGFADALAAGPAVAESGATLLLTDPTDAAEAEETVTVLGDVGGAVTIVGGDAAVTDQTPRQVRAVLAGNTLPGGGTVLFPKHRMIAYYGNAEVAALGVLGETSPEEAAQTISEIAEEYEDGEREVMPAFELIVSIALASPGPDGQYSAVGDPADVQEYLDVAREHDLYLFLDFQPGRNEFIDQVRLFEEFIRQPDVGIALDPEWRVTDSQRPGQLIGSADAAELNQVIDYAADIVREENLPQKLLVVHQFRTSMIRNRDALKTPDELAVTIHVDGFGTQDLKLETWGVLAGDDAPWWHGFKLFYDEGHQHFLPRPAVGLRRSRCRLGDLSVGGSVGRGCASLHLISPALLLRQFHFPVIMCGKWN